MTLVEAIAFANLVVPAAIAALIVVACFAFEREVGAPTGASGMPRAVVVRR